MPYQHMSINFANPVVGRQLVRLINVENWQASEGYGEQMVLACTRQQLENNYPLAYAALHGTQAEVGVLTDRSIPWDSLPWCGKHYPSVAVSFGPGRMETIGLIPGLPRSRAGHLAYADAVAWLAENPPSSWAGATSVGNIVARPTVIFEGDGSNEASVFVLFSPPETIGAAATSIGASTIKTELMESECSNCGIPGHSRGECTRTRVWDRIGIEIEGRWADLESVCDRASNKGISYCGDGSVHSSRFSDCQPHEFQTKPASPTKAIRQLLDFYPDECDTSCGMHVHVSFIEATHVSMLMTKGFFHYFRDRFAIWGNENRLVPDGEFFRRLTGENDYCNQNVESDNAFDADRYMQVNFRAWGEHGTVEFRLLPMFRNSALGVSAILELISILEDWLTKPEFANMCGCEAFAQLARMDADVTSPILGELMAENVEVDDGEPVLLTRELALAEIGPVPDGHVRRICSPDQITALNRLGIIPLAA